MSDPDADPPADGAPGGPAAEAPGDAAAPNAAEGLAAAKVAEGAAAPNAAEGLAAAKAAEGAAWASNLRSGLVWSAATFVGAKALTFVAVLILARILAPSDFGLLAGVLTFLALIELGSDLGMKAAVIYEQEHGVSARVQTAFTVNLIVAGVMTVAGVLVAPLVARLFGAESHAWLFRLASLNLLLTGLGNTHDALLLRDMGFSRRIRPQVVRELTRGVIAIALALDGVGAASLVIGHLAGTAAWCGLQWRLSPLRPDFSIERRAARSMISYGGQSAALEVLAVFATRIDVVVIGSSLGTAALGVYTIAYRLPDILIGSVAYTVTVVAFPALTRRRDQDGGGLLQGTLQLLRFQGLYAFPVAAAITVLSKPLVVVLFSDRWRGAAPVMVAVALASAVTTGTFALGDLLKAIGRQRFIVALNVVDIPLLIVGTIIAARRGGITAVAWVIFAVVLSFGIALTGFAKRAMGVGWGTVTRPLLPGLSTALGVAVGGEAVRLAYPAQTLPGLVVGALACGAGGLLALRVLARDTFIDLRRQLSDLIPSGRRRPVAVDGPSGLESAVLTDLTGSSGPEAAVVTGLTGSSGPDSTVVVGIAPAGVEPLRSDSVGDPERDTPHRLAQEAGRRVAFVIAAAEAEAAALLARGDQEATRRRAATIGEARAIVALARAVREDVAVVLEHVATAGAKLEISSAALGELAGPPVVALVAPGRVVDPAPATGPTLASTSGPGESASWEAVERAIAPVIAAAEAEAAALVRRAGEQAATQARDSVTQAAEIREIAWRVSSSSREIVGRLALLAETTVKLEAETAALDALSPAPGEPLLGPSDAGPVDRDPAQIGDGAAGTRPRAAAAPASTTTPRRARPANRAQPTAGAGREIDAGVRAATHVALRMAVAGVSRERVAAHLRDTLHLADPGPVLDYVFGVG
ncbi:MAG TPA: lipopolysaccharide biosynthesis protein [Solirubrobacteraceae bacterium]|jgi:PST family polysaccharide transporter|nr:lipopolysaccharide biosynthesis protein [Solirubrobacteraceae bacterium]